MRKIWRLAEEVGKNKFKIVESSSNIDIIRLRKRRYELVYKNKKYKI